MSQSKRRAAIGAVALASAVWVGPSARVARAQTAVDAPALAQRNADLQRKVDAMQRQLDALKQEVDAPAAPAPSAPTPPLAPTPTPASKASAPTDPFTSVFLDNTPVKLPGDVEAGYKEGFYIHQGDQFGVQVNGLFDVRYNFGYVKNKTTLGNTALGSKADGDYSGFNLFDGQLSVQGYLFKHDQQEVFFKAMGNFGTLAAPASGQGGSFIVNELYGGYAVNDALRFRAGAMIVPDTPLRSTTDYGGLTFPDVPDIVSPLLPGFGLGADVLGAAANNTISYDVMVNNGTTSNTLVNSTSPLVGRDNRLGIYTREQIVGSGTLKDFVDFSDLEDHQKLVWILGGGFAYESQNSSTTAFPGPQNTLRVSGLSSATGIGFIAPYTLNGDVFRYHGDVRFKYHGIGFLAEGLYQHIVNENGTFIPGYAQHSVGQVGYYAEAGYFLIPKRLEVAGRFAQLYTVGLPHEMDEYEGGVNYYFYGQNLKLQLAEIYVPRQAALSNANGLTLNTQDWITQVQLQLKF